MNKTPYVKVISDLRYNCVWLCHVIAVVPNPTSSQHTGREESPPVTGLLSGLGAEERKTKQFARGAVEEVKDRSLRDRRVVAWEAAPPFLPWGEMREGGAQVEGCRLREQRERSRPLKGEGARRDDALLLRLENGVLLVFPHRLLLQPHICYFIQIRYMWKRSKKKQRRNHGLIGSAGPGFLGREAPELAIFSEFLEKPWCCKNVDMLRGFLSPLSFLLTYWLHTWNNLKDIFAKKIPLEKIMYIYIYFKLLPGPSESSFLPSCI